MNAQELDIDKLEAGPEFNELVAERVMGWSIAKWSGKAEKPLMAYMPDRERPTYLPDFLNSATADYKVLCHVRENWSLSDYDNFVWRASDIWEKRRRARPTPTPKLGNLAMLYEPGDYSRAALRIALSQPSQSPEQPE